MLRATFHSQWLLCSLFVLGCKPSPPVTEPEPSSTVASDPEPSDPEPNSTAASDPDELAASESEPEAEGELGEAPAGDSPTFGAAGDPPKVSQAQAEVKGGLDKDIIRRIVRAHINEVRVCYNNGLKKNPDLAGQIIIAFTIGGAGNVPTAEAVDSDDFPDPEVATCIVKQVKKWKFPKPEGGGDVEVRYPFVLEPG